MKCWRHDYDHREYVCTCDPPVAGDTGRDERQPTTASVLAGLTATRETDQSRRLHDQLRKATT